MFEMLFGITLFALGSVFPILRDELKERLIASRVKNSVAKSNNVLEEGIVAFDEGFEAGYAEAMYEVNSKSVAEEPKIVSKGFDTEEWINTPPTPPKADTDVSDAYEPSLYNVDVEIMTEDRERELYKRVALGGV